MVYRVRRRSLPRSEGGNDATALCGVERSVRPYRRAQPAFLRIGVTRDEVIPGLGDDVRRSVSAREDVLPKIIFYVLVGRSERNGAELAVGSSDEFSGVISLLLRYKDGHTPLRLLMMCAGTRAGVHGPDAQTLEQFARACSKPGCCRGRGARRHGRSRLDTAAGGANGACAGGPRVLPSPALRSLPGPRLSP